jgi:hypothetical protein
VLTCLENTFRPERNGARQTVKEVLNRNRATCHTPEGVAVTIYLPTRRRDIEQLDPNTFRWPLGIGGGANLVNHTVTYRFGS